MHPDVFVALLAVLAVVAFPFVAWLRAQKRIRDLEMTLLTRTIDAERYDELLGLLKQIATQTDQLADTQTQLARRLAERGERMLPPAGEPSPLITPH